MRNPVNILDGPDRTYFQSPYVQWTNTRLTQVKIHITILGVQNISVPLFDTQPQKPTYRDLHIQIVLTVVILPVHTNITHNSGVASCHCVPDSSTVVQWYSGTVVACWLVVESNI